MPIESVFYVYMYRDPRSSSIRYVGVGTRRAGHHQRVEDHLDSAKAPGFGDWLRDLAARNLSPVIELIQCESRAEALAIEAALISALWTPLAERGPKDLFNQVHGHHKKFVPLGLPQELANRRFLPYVTRERIAELGGALVVYINTREFTDVDPRKGAAPRSSLTDQEVRDRIERWWQIGPWLDAWQSGDSPYPARIIGLAGPAGRRWIWGSIRVTKTQWRAARQDSGGLFALDLGAASVDSRQLRGRRVAHGEFGPQVSKQGVRSFNSFRSQAFDVIEPVADAPADGSPVKEQSGDEARQ